MTTLKKFPSCVNQELNLPPPGAIDHIDDIEDDDDDANSDDDNGRYELWTFRVPASLNVSDLDGVEIDLEAITKGAAAGNKNNASAGGMKVNDGKLSIGLGETVENENFRLLVPSGSGGKQKEEDDSDDDSSSDDDDDDDNETNGNNNNKFVLHTSSKGFKRHFNVHKNVLSRKSEAELAPSEGPEPSGGAVLRHAYCRIPQRKGMKRRWMPLGAPQSAKDIPTELVVLKQEQGTDNTGTSAAAAASVTSDDDEVKTSNNNNNTKASKGNKSSSSSSKRRRSEGESKKRAASGNNGEKSDRGGSSSTPKKKRIKSEKSSSNNTPGASATKSEKKSAKKSEKKSKKRKSLKKEKKNDDDAMSV